LLNTIEFSLEKLDPLDLLPRLELLDLPGADSEMVSPLLPPELEIRGPGFEMPGAAPDDPLRSASLKKFGGLGVADDPLTGEIDDPLPERGVRVSWGVSADLGTASSRGMGREQEARLPAVSTGRAINEAMGSVPTAPWATRPRGSSLHRRAGWAWPDEARPLTLHVAQERVQAQSPGVDRAGFDGLSL
jgi:hypothetical protein